MIAVKVSGLDQTVKKFTALPNDLKAARLRAVGKLAIETRNELFKSMSAVGVPDAFWGLRSPAGPVLAARTGHTRSALSPGRVWVVGETVFGAVGHDEPHVLANEVGATIKPQHGQFLRIPTANALTASGTDRWQGMSIRAIPGARIVRTKAGRVWALRDVGQNRIELLYLLVREVTLKPKGLFANVTRIMDARAAGVATAEVVFALKKAS